MATYVISDIHGQYNMFIELLDKIDLKDTDTLYILGDVLDRGPHPIKTIRKLMEMPNAICLVGNHEFMAMKCLEFLMKEITDKSIEELDDEMLDNLETWQYNGSRSTVDEFTQMDFESKKDVIDFIKEFLIYEEVSVNDKNYLLVHGGLGNYSPEKDIDDYSLHELIWSRADYNIQYFSDKYVITGHTPTQAIRNNPNPGYIYRQNNHIAIDCGATYPGGRLAAICLDTGEEYYSEPNKMGSDVLAYDEKDVAAKTHYENKYFSIDVPEDWIGYWDVIEEENSLYVDQILYRLSYKPPVENYGGGTEIYILDISDTSVPLSVYRASIPDYAEESRGCIIH